MKKLLRGCKLTNIVMNYALIVLFFYFFKIRLPNKNGQQRQLIRQLDTKNSTCPCLYNLFKVCKYFDPLRSNYGMEMKRSTKKLDDKRFEIKARHFKNVSWASNLSKHWSFGKKERKEECWNAKPLTMICQAKFSNKHMCFSKPYHNEVTEFIKLHLFSYL